MKGRVEIVPEKLAEFSAIQVIFSNYENIQIYPRAKRLIFEDGTLIENVNIIIKSCHIGRKLEIEIGEESYKSLFDIYRILTKK